MPLDPTKTVKIGTVNVEDEGVEENFSRTSKPSVTRTVRVAWGDRFQLYIQLLGTGVTVSGSVTSEVGPLKYPDAPWLRALSVDLAEMLGTPSVGPNGAVAYDTARIKISYGMPDYDPVNSEANISFEIGEELMSLPQDFPAYKWDDNGLNVPADVLPGIPISVGHFRYKMKFQAGRPTALLETFVDTTNDATFFGYAAGTLLYKGFSSDPVFSMAGEAQTNVVHNWKYRKNDGNGWNYFFRPKTPTVAGGWKKIVRKDNGQPPFPPKNQKTVLGLP